ncbi:unnamed protein product [Clavelina lepadiformis]|uniref:Uncharacterized protein n=1 Tax=Clavelina lepadiformis TaxID=159417 RepID=A0ABP0FX35_CLALP
MQTKEYHRAELSFLNVLHIRCSGAHFSYNLQNIRARRFLMQRVKTIAYDRTFVYKTTSPLSEKVCGCCRGLSESLSLRI